MLPFPCVLGGHHAGWSFPPASEPIGTDAATPDFVRGFRSDAKTITRILINYSPLTRMQSGGACSQRQQRALLQLEQDATRREYKYNDLAIYMEKEQMSEPLRTKESIMQPLLDHWFSMFDDLFFFGLLSDLRAQGLVEVSPVLSLRDSWPRLGGLTRFKKDNKGVIIGAKILITLDCVLSPSSKRITMLHEMLHAFKGFVSCGKRACSKFWQADGMTGHGVAFLDAMFHLHLCLKDLSCIPDNSGPSLEVALAKEVAAHLTALKTRTHVPDPTEEQLRGWNMDAGLFYRRLFALIAREPRHLQHLYLQRFGAEERARRLEMLKVKAAQRCLELLGPMEVLAILKQSGTLRKRYLDLASEAQLHWYLDELEFPARLSYLDTRRSADVMTYLRHLIETNAREHADLLMEAPLARSIFLKRCSDCEAGMLLHVLPRYQLEEVVPELKFDHRLQFINTQDKKTRNAILKRLPSADRTKYRRAREQGKTWHSRWFSLHPSSEQYPEPVAQTTTVPRDTVSQPQQTEAGPSGSYDQDDNNHAAEQGLSDDTYPPGTSHTMSLAHESSWRRPRSTSPHHTPARGREFVSPVRDTSATRRLISLRRR